MLVQGTDHKIHLFLNKFFVCANNGSQRGRVNTRDLLKINDHSSQIFPLYHFPNINPEINRFVFKNFSNDTKDDNSILCLFLMENGIRLSKALLWGTR
jgi:hypothetical protein